MKDNRLLVRVDAALKRRLEEAASETHKFRHAVRDRRCRRCIEAGLRLSVSRFPSTLSRHAGARSLALI